MRVVEQRRVLIIHDFQVEKKKEETSPSAHEGLQVQSDSTETSY